MLEEIFIMCFYGIIYLKIEGGEKEKNFLDFDFEIFEKIFWSPALPVYFSGLFYFVYSSSIIVTIPLSEFHATPGGVASRVL